MTEQELMREAANTGFQKEPLEKVIRLSELLESLRSHPFLKPRIALKGGTALNLFVFDVPRLSVDIDLNYIGAVDRDTMFAERPKVEQAVQAVHGRHEREQQLPRYTDNVKRDVKLRGFWAMRELDQKSKKRLDQVDKYNNSKHMQNFRTCLNYRGHLK